MKKRVIEGVSVQIEKLIPGGYGLGTLENGKKCLLFNALPGEIVTELKVIKDKSSYLEGVATAILNPSPFRVVPKDKCYLSTSPWQILDYKYELLAKQEIVVELFREQGLYIETPEIVTDGCEYFYRNKMEYALYYDLEKLRIFPAFHLRGSHAKVPILDDERMMNGELISGDTTNIADGELISGDTTSEISGGPVSNGSSLERPEILQRAIEIIAELNRKGEDARKYQSLLLRCNAEGEVAGGLFENKKPHPVFPNLTDEILGRKYTYSPNGFFQVNLPVYELALKEIDKQIESEKVLDLYAGVGTIGLSVARKCDLTLVEVDKSAYRELRRNTEKSGLPVSRAVLSKSEEALDLITKGQTVILDPPRAGCDGKLIEKLLEVAPEKIIYLSCNPATEARDVKLLSSQYEIAMVKTFNFFPHTPHIENLVVLKSKKQVQKVKCQ